MNELVTALRTEVGRVVRDADATVDALVAAATLGGHVLLEGPPGVAKTLTATALGRALRVDVHRIQLTPDMLPSDITGSVALRGGELVFRPGPVFCQLLIADEINRTPPKTQSALLEAMQEGAVSVDGQRHPLPEPFLLVATQNPVEHEGTYPLPEAQLDRFLLKVRVGYPDEAAERELVTAPRDGLRPAALEDVAPVADAAALLAARATVAETYVHADVAAYVVGIVRATRALPSVALGASPRAGVHLLAAAQAYARIGGRDFVTPDDVRAAAEPVLAHRIVLAPEAELEGMRDVDAVAAAVGSVPVPASAA
ncbi:MoxR family ATPase [Patulibacter brassicae]|jgi:MoxR-like ATPase|uniref:MoxR family ATPase n=1 Tax=Patulibacter brassicae TaxID=1705717 RepID=A0ABU4VK82_9ACTN|nr:MoxR family ATPase [Patulibacter brassicae]MDX8152242.1 MoxR family ATPase [Patulibacter brassicae]